MKTEAEEILNIDADKAFTFLNENIWPVMARSGIEGIELAAFVILVRILIKLDWDTNELMKIVAEHSEHQIANDNTKH